ncbi:OsmC family protein [Flexibacterium corallicola]|uniref:OsmC family protein n=1 Tax=Flexibacterium corallicola TaxID=3037259 RepID=UPI00286F80FC|nr:OsmC family protein [Pseudovibrio sp. M1P-2-3]
MPLELVKKVDSLHPLLRMELGKSNQSETGFAFDINLTGGKQPGAGFFKSVSVMPNILGYGAFEVSSDEGIRFGGTDKAPAPLDYLACGVAFCFLSHITYYQNMKKLDLTSVKVEQKLHFSVAENLINEKCTSTEKGKCERIDLYVIVESPEPAEEIVKMIETCKAACLALQAIMEPVPAHVELVHNP